MRHDPAGPADTRMMGIVHDALRRDLGRLRAVLTGAPPGADQRAALGAHLEWMLDFLHEHHHGEDAGLYPLVLAKNPAARDTARHDGRRPPPGGTGDRPHTLGRATVVGHR